MDKQIAQTITDILVNKIGLEKTEVTADANFAKDLGIDSLDYAELIMEFEQAFDIKISDDDAEGLTTLSEVVSFVKGKINDKK
jgi:acyl carrier protein